MGLDNKQQIFLSLLRAGLWEQNVRLLPYSPIDFDALYQLAEEHSVVGLIAAGLEHVEDTRVSKPQALPFLKKVFSLEQRNQAMNAFISNLFASMRSANLSPVLIKGQGVGQCYLRPPWRAAGDVDLLIGVEDYEKAKKFLLPLAEKNQSSENTIVSEYCTQIDQWAVELHGTLHNNLSKKINDSLDHTVADILNQGGVRVWKDGETEVFLPSPDNDIIVVFAHILQHLYCGGIGLRQICDWIRLLWTYRHDIDIPFLKHRLVGMRIMEEWQVLGHIAVNYLGMPKDAMPFYSESMERKSNRLLKHILDSGNFGRSRDRSYQERHKGVVRKVITMGHQIKDSLKLSLVFPQNASQFLVSFIIYRTGKAIGEMKATNEMTI